MGRAQRIGDYSDFILAHQYLPVAAATGIKPSATHLALDKAVYEPLISPNGGRTHTRHSSNLTMSPPGNQGRSGPSWRAQDGHRESPNVFGSSDPRQAMIESESDDSSTSSDEDK